jgi:hypothetical protein
MSDLAHPVIRSDKAASLPVIFLGILGAIQMSDPMVANLALVKATKALSFSRRCRHSLPHFDAGTCRDGRAVRCCG